jgi:hypothetical protein
VVVEHWLAEISMVFMRAPPFAWLQGLLAWLPLLEFRFGFCSPSELTDGSAVFRTEPLSKPRGLPFPLGEKPRRKCQQCNDHHTGNNDLLQGNRIHVYVLWCSIG